MCAPHSTAGIPHSLKRSPLYFLARIRTVYILQHEAAARGLAELRQPAANEFPKTQIVTSKGGAAAHHLYVALRRGSLII